MAVAQNTRYNTNAAIREDLEDIIYDISPMETYFMSNVERTTVRNTLHEWQIDALAAPSTANAQIEGDDISAVTVVDTTRYKNYAMISRKEIVISGTLEAVRKAGKDSEVAYQMMKRGKELKRDIETIALHNKSADAGSQSTPRIAAGVETWLHTSLHFKLSGNSTGTTTAPAAGIATAAAVDGTATALVDADLASALAIPWTNGGETDIILVPNAVKNRINQFSGIATRFRDVGSRQQAQIIGAADVYVSNFGSHKVILSRYMRPTTLLLLDLSLWAIGYLRPIQQKDIARTGDSEKRMLLAEWTLIAKNPNGNAKITGIS